MRRLSTALCALFVPFAAHAQSDLPTGKLPDTAVPTAYRLGLTVLPSADRFTGHAEIDITLKKAARTVYMHGRDLKVTKATATVGGETFPVTLKQVTPLGLDTLDFGREVAPGKITLKFDYSAPFGTGASGLYHVQVGDAWYSWTQFESIDARAAFPSFDEPGYKTPFTVSLTTKPGFTAVSNAPETGSRKTGKLVTHRFEVTKPLPTYLVAFAVGPFETMKATAQPTPERGEAMPVRVVATKAQAGKLGFAAENTGRIVGLLEKYFGESFPFPKLDQIGSPIMPGAMENAGADIYGDDILLLDKNPTTRDKQTFGMVVAHELSHQWFGDLVTPEWWDDIWLNESFANWMGFRIGNEWRPDLNIGSNRLEDGFQAMQTDSLKAGRPIHGKIENDADINSAFDSITYGKGGHVVAMIAAYMGDKEFQKGVRLHLKRHAYGNASTEDFFKSLADAAGDPRVVDAMKSFVDQQGVPVVTIHHQAGKLVASQSRYAFLGTDLAPESWTIPLCLRRGEHTQCSLLGDAPKTLSLPGKGAIMPNAGGTGYYRFELDPGDWNALIRTAPDLAPGEGLALDDSLWASVQAGKTAPDRLIPLARAAAKNPDSNVAVDNGERFAYLAGHDLIPEDAMPAYRTLIGDLYGPLLDRLGFDPARTSHDGDTPDEQKLRQSVVALMVGGAKDQALRNRIETAASRYLDGDDDAIADSYLGTGLSLLVDDNDLAYAKQLTDRALTSDDARFRRRALGAVAGSGDMPTAKWLLGELKKDERLRTPETLYLLGGIAGQKDTRQMALDYMLANFDSITRDAGIFAALRIPGLFGGSCSLNQANALESALGPKVKAAGVGMLGFNRTIERIRTCARFKAARSDAIGEALLAAK